MRILWKGRRWAWLGAIVLTMALVAVGSQNVSTTVTPEDAEYAEHIMSAAGYIGERRQFGDLLQFESQVRAVAAVQDAVLVASPTNIGVALNRQREPKDLFLLKQGLCFDRSRAIEKLLTYLGLEVRHVAVYATASRSALAALLTPENPSHAVSEVRTAKGWLLVDSNNRWLGVDANRNPVSTLGLKKLSERRGPWAPESKARINPIFLDDFVFVYGLYSRHGRFYPPFTSFPDVNFRQLVSNLSE
jgi:hypothetical protein